jgi:hypothetical protein
MSKSTFLSWLSHFQIPILAFVTPIALACSTSAFCGEIHDAVKVGDMAKIKALLKDEMKAEQGAPSDPHPVGG